ncbi:MAG: AraC family transcriptional regulator [Sciscionella sp.]|nr:AraC family transcriptional regulator [Sciscionella sp.]
MRTVPIHFVQRLLRVADRRGLDLKPLLRKAGIPADIAEQPMARVTIEQAAVLTRGLYRITGDEMFGLGPPLPLGTVEFMALAIIHAPDLRTILTRMAHATTTVVPGAPGLCVEFGDRVTVLRVDVSQLDDPEHLGVDVLIAFVHRFIGWLIGRRIPLLSLEFPYTEPPYATDYDRIYGRAPTFDPNAGDVVTLSLDSALLDAPIVRDEDDLLDFMRHQPIAWLGTRDYGSSTADRVRKVLERGLRGDWPTPEEIAARLTVSAQHLRRLLRAEHTSITAIRAEILRDEAIASLARGDEPVDALAVRLGFSEASALRRAFRRWTGSPLSAYRTREK